MDHRPTGTITFLFSDIEASTDRWETNVDQMQIAFELQEQIMRASMNEHAGYVYKMIGDAFQVAFDTALDALKAAISAQRKLQTQSWDEMEPLKVRMALHTGVVEERGDDYVGPLLNRAARLLDAGHGGQVLISQATYELLRDIIPDSVNLRDLGAHRLKDLARGEQIFQLDTPFLQTDFPPLRTLDSKPNNLPIQITSFVGRNREFGEVRNLLEGNRLVTLTGLGGAGKTRLALQLAADLLDEFEQGVWWVDLASLEDPELIGQAIAGVLSIREETQKPLLDTISQFLRDKHLLLILDNCEHIVDKCASIADELLRSSLGLKILATSREAFRIRGEHSYPVLSLSVPDLTHLPGFERLSQYDAVRLFIDRAIAVSPGFSVDNKNAPVVAEICYRLDGIPLAIELAAARVGVMPVEMILSRIDDRFRLLSKGDRAVMPRHQTLAAVIDWSYNLLDDDECALFRSLGVFPGGWSLQAAEIVCCNEIIAACDVFELMTSLVEKSLVQIDQGDERYRYRMLETVRQYAHQKSIAAGEIEQIKFQFIKYYLDLIEESEKTATSDTESAIPKKLAFEMENFRAALTWSMQDPAKYGDAGLRMAGSLWNVWWILGYLNEGRAWLEKAIKLFQSKGSPRAKALTNAGCISWQQGDYEIAEVYISEAIGIYKTKAVDDLEGLANATHIYGHVVFELQDYINAKNYFEQSLMIYRNLEDQANTIILESDVGNIHYHQGDYESAKIKYIECLELSRAINDQRLVAANLLRLGNIYRLEEDYESAKELYEESLGITREMEWSLELASSLHRLGFVSQRRGNLHKAAQLFNDGLDLQVEMGNKQGIAECLAGLAGLAVVCGHEKSGIRLFAATNAFLNEFNVPLGPADQAEWERDLYAARSKIDERGFQAQWQLGEAYSFEQMISSAKKFAAKMIDL